MLSKRQSIRLFTMQKFTVSNLQSQWSAFFGIFGQFSANDDIVDVHSLWTQSIQWTSLVSIDSPVDQKHSICLVNIQNGNKGRCSMCTVYPKLGY